MTPHPLDVCQRLQEQPMWTDRLMLIGVIGALLMMCAFLFRYGIQDAPKNTCAVQQWKGEMVLVCPSQLQFDRIYREPLPGEGAL